MTPVPTPVLGPLGHGLKAIHGIMRETRSIRVHDHGNRTTSDLTRERKGFWIKVIMLGHK